MCGVRQGLSNARASSAFARLWLTALFILVVMNMAHRLTCKKLRVLSRLRRSQPAPNIRNPAPLRTHWCPCVDSSSCLAPGKCQKRLERARPFLPLSSLLLTYYYISFLPCSPFCFILFYAFFKLIRVQKRIVDSSVLPACFCLSPD